MLMHFQSPGDSCRNKKHGKTRNNLFRDTALLVAAVLLTTAFWSGVTLDKSSISILVGASETLAATVSPKDAANKKVTWKSDKPEIASVDANGKVTGVKAGEATITVTTEDGGRNGPHCGPISQRSFLCFCFHINRNPNKTTTV